MKVCELSSGHVFVMASVRAITPLQHDIHTGRIWFCVVGVGYSVEVMKESETNHLWDSPEEMGEWQDNIREWSQLRDQAILALKKEE